ncbi:uncharacterized protein E0L32_002528 [Thyridium curvatum]|uniref:NADP-dependent oxidoreductase domain-containing protein n=1 Tax=Thyridium curvatum TaxID=1093900 RepID=A0A507BN64_9PEZI|nr:uncharacterized protein E0L32_002528 [Thyridium curvatum]TPX18671.1 hypothetical protein E0L32_002528 [Thyridium curvatum]
MASKTYTLADGTKIPALGFGTFANEGAKGQTYAAVTKALEVGYRHLDCAWFYQNEGEVGDALRDFLAARPDVKRADIFICTKVWNHLHEPEDVAWSARDSLRSLGVDYVDLYLMHWPIASERNDDYSVKLGPDGRYVIKEDLTADLQPTWRAMEKLVDEGLVRSLGVSNFTAAHLTALLGYARVKPVVNQVEIHPYLPNAALVDFCLRHGVMPVAYSPLGSQDQVPTTGMRVRDDPGLNAVADRTGHTLAQVLLAWGLRRGYVVLPKSSTPSRIESNFQVPELAEEDFAAIEEVARGKHFRFVNMKDTFGHDVWADEA